jgi:hypothetical protein
MSDPHEFTMKGMKSMKKKAFYHGGHGAHGEHGDAVLPDERRVAEARVARVSER